MFAILWHYGKEYICSTRRYRTFGEATKALAHWTAYHEAQGLIIPGQVVGKD